MVSNIDPVALQSEKQYFIETNRGQASYFQWLSSKGTNFTCYLNYMNSLGNEDFLNNKIDIVRNVIYALHSPIKFLFFYWTVLILILHKFNFKKPVVKIVLGHFLIRSTGDVLDKFGQLLSMYYINSAVTDEYGTSYTCSVSGNMHPLRWFITRQLGTVFWYVGEIIGDWYPLLRTKAVIRDKKSLYFVYFSCGIFNLSKIALIILHWSLSPTQLYDENGVYELERVNIFYFRYWIIQLIIIYASVFYDFSVYFVLKKNIFNESHSNFGFIKKFKSISEYRIFISSIVSIIFLPIVSITIILKYYYYFKYNYTNLNFSFDEIRQSIANVQYYMIFIDQILLMTSKKNGHTTSSSLDAGSSNNKSNLSNISLKTSSKFQYKNLNNSTTTFINTNQNMSDYTYTYGNYNGGETIVKISNDQNTDNNYENFSNSRKKSLANSSDTYNNESYDRKMSIPLSESYESKRSLASYDDYDGVD
eukprot:jgi/Orpsp1_1/1176678/evm.model.c7180000058574.1